MLERAMEVFKVKQFDRGVLPHVLTSIYGSHPFPESRLAPGYSGWARCR